MEKALKKDSTKGVKVGDKLYITNGIGPLVRVDLATYMTGQEWYDRFKGEFYEFASHGNYVFPGNVMTEVMEAAKKASRIE